MLILLYKKLGVLMWAESILYIFVPKKSATASSGIPQVKLIAPVSPTASKSALKLPVEAIRISNRTFSVGQGKCSLSSAKRTETRLIPSDCVNGVIVV